MAGALRRAQGAKAELEDEQARLEEENAALHARVRELEEAGDAAGGGSGRAHGVDRELLERLQGQVEGTREQLAEERARAARLEEELGRVREAHAQAQARAGGGEGVAAERAAEQGEEAEALRAQVAALQETLQITMRGLQRAEEEKVIAIEEREDMLDALHHVQKHSKPKDVAPVPQPPGISITDEQLEHLENKMNSLEGGRKVLINEIDAQALEIERLFTENKHLAESVLKSKALSEEWERQAQGSLQQNERLQDMLEESAAWSAGERRAGPAGADGAALEAGGDFELRWREESLKCASLEVQLAKVAVEVTQAKQVNAQLAESMLPILTGIEGALIQAKKTGGV